MCCLLHQMMSHHNAQCYTYRVPLPPATVSIQSPGHLASGSQHARALEFCTHLPLYVLGTLQLHSQAFPQFSFDCLLPNILILITCIKVARSSLGEGYQKHKPGVHRLT